MWISKAHFKTLDNEQRRNLDLLERQGALRQMVQDLERDNIRQRSDIDWFKHRLNQVERERGQLIQAALGVKIAVPEFVPTYENPAAALNDMPDLSSVGMDAHDQGGTPDTDGAGVDYSMMPGYKKG